MGVSKNNGTPKSSHFDRAFRYFHHPFWGFYPYFWKHPYGHGIDSSWLNINDGADVTWFIVLRIYSIHVSFIDLLIYMPTASTPSLSCRSFFKVSGLGQGTFRGGNSRNHCVNIMRKTKTISGHGPHSFF